MTKAVVDTNIVFSAFLNTSSRIAQPLISGSSFFRFYAPDYLKDEIAFHKSRIMKLSSLNEEGFQEVYRLLLRNVSIIDMKLIPEVVLVEAEKLCENIDPDDFAFVALGLYLKAPLWTGDKRLIAGLTGNKRVRFVSTDGIFEALIDAENRERWTSISKRKKK